MSTDILHSETNKVLVSMSLPISIGMLSTFLFQVIDTYFVGKLGPEALAALSFSSTVYFMLVGLFIGLAVGVSIIIGKAAGENNPTKVNQVTLVALFLSFLASSFLGALCIVFVEPIFSLMGADQTLIPLIKEYVVPVLCGIPLLTIGLLGGGVLRTTGNVKVPEIIMACAGVINLVLDYLFIFGKGGFEPMGIEGAAYATFCSWVFILIGILSSLIKNGLMSVNLGDALSRVMQHVKEITTLGLPTVVTQIIGPGTMIYITFLLSREGADSVAAFGVAGRIEMLIMIGILGVSTALTPFIAQNLGAKETKRIEESIVFGGKASTYLGLLTCITMLLLVPFIARLFSSDPEVISHTTWYFYIVSGSYVLYGLFLITSSVFNGLQLPVNSLKIMAIKSILFTVPLTLVGSILVGAHGVFGGIAIANVLGGIYAAHEMKKELRRVGSSLADVNVFRSYKDDIVRLIRGKNQSYGS